MRNNCASQGWGPTSSIKSTLERLRIARAIQSNCFSLQSIECVKFPKGSRYIVHTR